MGLARTPSTTRSGTLAPDATRSMASKRVACVGVTAGFVLGLLMGLFSSLPGPWGASVRAQGACDRSCASGTARDARGCCVHGEDRHAGSGPRARASRSSHGWGGTPECEGGTVATQDTRGHCCWPGQYWVPSDGRCAGTPTCPADRVPKQDGDCGCPDGQTSSVDTDGHCCWPGQTWLPSRLACVGTAACPRGYSSSPDGVACVREGGAESTDAGVDVPAMGVLKVNSMPWSLVYVDNRLVGNTPQTNIQLTAGTHRVTLINPDFQLREDLSVTIEPGQTATRVVRFSIPQ